MVGAPVHAGGEVERSRARQIGEEAQPPVPRLTFGGGDHRDRPTGRSWLLSEQEAPLEWLWVLSERRPGQNRTKPDKFVIVGAPMAMYDYSQNV